MSDRWRFGAGFFLAVLLLCAVPSVSWAQSSIAGQVSDATGAVLPGVTVEATSPSLIEGSRVVVTDAQGQYLLTELRPGTYKVTFTLPGFSTTVREGIELTTGFTASVSVQMRVGGLEETITVAGASPVVDVRSVRTQAVATREIQDVLPTGRNAEAFGRLIPGSSGAALNPDVGGSAAMQRRYLAFRGSEETVQLNDGFRQHIATSASAVGEYFNNGALQEIQYVTGGESAEGTGGGMKINLIPKDGGNTFSGTLYGDYTRWSSENFDQELRDKGLLSAPTILKIWDFNSSYGGPVKRNTLWFQLTYRNWGVDKLYPNSFSEITGEPGHDGGHINSTVARLTWQMSHNHKLTTSYTYPPTYRSAYNVDSYVAPSVEATGFRTVPATYSTQNKWTATLTSKLLVVAGISSAASQWVSNVRENGVTGPGQAVRAFPETGALYDPYYANTDLVTGAVRGTDPAGHRHDSAHVANYIASLAYVTGSHSFKAGMDIANISGRGEQVFAGDQTIQWRNGIPDSVLVRASPRNTKDRIWNHAFYAQDIWTFKRLTLNGGLRFEYDNGSVPEQWSGAGTYVPERVTPAVKNIPRWFDLAPRAGVSWDVFGDGKTALKFSGGRYATPALTNLVTSQNNPMQNIVYTATARWLGDFNGNHVPDLNERGPLSNAFFGTVRPNSTYDPAVLEGFQASPYSVVYAATLQHELIPRLGLTTSVYQTKYYNQKVTDNRAIGPSDFDEFTVVSPRDPRLPGGGGETIGGLYVIRDDKRPLSDPYTTFAENYGDHGDTYRGFDVSVDWRGPNGNMLVGGIDWGQRYVKECYVVDTPQLRFCERRQDSSANTRGGLSVKFIGAVALPSRWQLSGTLQSNRGPEILANWTTRDADRTLTFVNGTRASLGATPSVTVQLIEPGTQYGERFVQFDLRGSRMIELGQARVRLNVDLYNVFNGNFIIAQNNVYGSTWLQPRGILEARLLKFGAQLDF